MSQLNKHLWKLLNYCRKTGENTVCTSFSAVLAKILFPWQNANPDAVFLVIVVAVTCHVHCAYLPLLYPYLT